MFCTVKNHRQYHQPDNEPFCIERQFFRGINIHFFIYFYPHIFLMRLIVMRFAANQKTRHSKNNKHLKLTNAHPVDYIYATIHRYSVVRTPKCHKRNQCQGKSSLSTMEKFSYITFLNKSGVSAQAEHIRFILIIKKDVHKYHR